MRNENSFQGAFSVAKGAVLALCCSLALSFIFACVLRACNLSQGVIYTVNQVVKTLSVAVGAIVFVRGEKGWLKGGVIGLIFTMLSYLAFSAIGGDFSLSWLIVVETAVGLFSGALCGVIAVNIKG